MGKAAASTALSLIREVVFGVGFALLLPVFWGLDGVLFSMPASDVLAFLVAVVLIVRTWRELSAKQKGARLPSGPDNQKAAPDPAPLCLCPVCLFLEPFHQANGVLAMTSSSLVGMTKVLTLASAAEMSVFSPRTLFFSASMAMPKHSIFSHTAARTPMSFSPIAGGEDDGVHPAHHGRYKRR